MLLGSSSLHSNILVCADIGVKKIRTAAHDLGSEGRSERTRQKEYPVLAESRPNILRKLDGVASELFEADFSASARVHAGESPSTAALVPLNEGEVLLPGTQVRCEDGIRATGTSVENKEDGVILMLTPYPNPLVYFADPDEALSHDSVSAFDP
jgi:hypothetical protein